MSREFDENMEKTDDRPYPQPEEDSPAAPSDIRSRRKPGTSQRSAGGAAEAGPKKGAFVSGTGLTLRQQRELSRRKKRRRMIIMIAAECIALTLILAYGYFLRRWNQIQRPQFNEVEIKNNDLDMDTVERMKGYWTIAVFGVDARDKTLTKSTNADVNIICNVNLDTGEIKLVSVYRDTYLNISKSGVYNKINMAYFQGGPEQAVAALNRNLDLNITDYMTFNWKAVADAINILGGVDVEISKAEFYYINSFITETVKATGVGSHQLKSAGMNHLDGVQAVAYGRLRLMDTDYARTERQRKIIKLAFEKAKKADLDTLNRVLATVFPQVATSINLNDLFNSLSMINRYHLGETTGFPQARGDADMGKKGSCVIPQTLESNVIKLHEFLFGEENYVPSATVKNIGAKIASDTGRYKESKFMGDVGTDGGVIQSVKASKAAEAESKAVSESETDDDARYAVVYVLDRDGNKVKKSVPMEKNEDGEYIEPETYANGVAKGWSLNKDGKLVEKETDEYGDEVEPEVPGSDAPTAAETDEYGDLIIKGSGQTSEGEKIPTAPETDENGDPVTTEESDRTSLHRPGDEEEEENNSGAGNESNNTAPTAPTSTSPTSPTSPTTPTTPTSPTSEREETKGTSGVVAAPGSNTLPASEIRPTAGNSDRPGSTQSTGNAGSGVVSAPGAPNSAGTVPDRVQGSSVSDAPGSGRETAIGNNSPGM